MTNPRTSLDHLAIRALYIISMIPARTIYTSILIRVHDPKDPSTPPTHLLLATSDVYVLIIRNPLYHVFNTYLARVSNPHMVHLALLQLVHYVPCKQTFSSCLCPLFYLVKTFSCYITNIKFHLYLSKTNKMFSFHKTFMQSLSLM